MVAGTTIALVIIAVIALYFIFSYNRIIRLRNQIDNAWSQIDVQLKRRTDLIPNLIETVKGYAKHEKTVLADVTKARAGLMKAKTPAQMAKASNQIESTLKTLFAVSENYPQLKANENFLQLQEELSGTESKIAYARQFYNDSVLSFNNIIQQFPGSVFANAFRFQQREFFEAEASERKPIKVKF